MKAEIAAEMTYSDRRRMSHGVKVWPPADLKLWADQAKAKEAKP